jgi:hypothetical protein
VTFADLVTDITNELNLDTANPRSVAQLYSWANSIYRTVVGAEEYPWRKRDVPILTEAYGTGTGPFTKDADLHGPTTVQSGLTSDACAYNFLVLDDFDTVYELQKFAWYGGQAQIIELAEPFLHPTNTYDFRVYKPRYQLGNIREDWVVGVYNNTDECLLERVYPNYSMAYIHQGIKNPSVPRFYFMEGANTAAGLEKGSLLSLSPAPDGVYELTVKTLLGVETLTESSSTIIIPDIYAPDIFKYGIGLLYSVKQKDKEGVELYGGLYNKTLRDMIDKAGKEPGRSRRMIGYVLRDAGIKDPDVPKDWDPGF